MLKIHTGDARFGPIRWIKIIRNICRKIYDKKILYRKIFDKKNYTVKILTKSKIIPYKYTHNLAPIEEDLKTGKTFGNWLKVRDVVQKRKLSVPREDDVTNRISEISFNYIYSRRESTLSSRDHQNLQVYQQDVKKENEKRKFKSPAVAAKTDGARDKWHRSFLNILDAKNRTKFQNLLELINRKIIQTNLLT